MQFRSDINGLRAIAILAVVLFHFKPEWLPGGFVGVDVFFVISGFLMTAIIFTGIEKNTFNIFTFYNARANRIIPVLGIMAAVLLVFGWFYLSPHDYQELGKEVEQSLIFNSNNLFAKGGGYFDTNEKTKWLLHTWSLSVEWQFYIIFPFIILIAKKYLSLCNLKKLILMLFFSGFIYCVYGTSKDSKTAYFIITSRAWEMLLGGVAFLYPLSIKDIKIRIILQNIGFFLILYSCFFISDNVPWPGYMAIIPVLGAYLIVLSNNQNNIFINNVFFRYIGKWSYSIYVWHWPFVILGVYFSFKNWWVFGIVFSIIIGFLSYQFIEKIKFKKFTLWKEIFKVKPFYIFLVVISCGYAVNVTDGFKSHYSKEILNIDSESKNSNPYKCDSGLLDNHEMYKCKIGNQGNLKAIVVGDSHADALTTSVSNNLNLTKQGIVSLATSGCPFILNANFDSSYRTCPEINEKRVEYLKNNPQIPIIIINRYLQRLEGENDPERIERKKPPIIYFSRKDVSKDELYKEFENNLKVTVCSLTKKSPVYIVLSIPEVGFNVPERMSKQLLVNKKFDDNSIEFSQYEYRAGRLNKILVNVANTCGAKILNPTEILCRNGKCITQYNGRSIYRDSNHLSEYGNKLLSPMFKKALTE